MTEPSPQTFDDPAADICLVAKNGMRFKIRRSFLVQSAVLDDMLAVGGSGDSSMPEVKVEETSGDLALLLSYLV